MSFGGRLAAALGLLVIAAGLAVWAVVGFMLPTPPTVDFTSAQPPGAPVDLTIQTVGSIGYGEHPTWVSYLIKDPSGQWIHSTIWKVPAHTRINLTIQQFDSGSPLRNQQWGMVVGTVGGTATLNGKPFSVYDSNSGNGVGHTFSIPTLGISVPLVANPSSASNICSQAPCSAPSSIVNIIKASFFTPGAGEYPWQCFVPCGLGWLFGNGGPMSTVGYMGGFLDVVA
ncbi:MAG TPA: hypothetical protein VIC86_09515 [Acidimicrobiales bacterium]|jgi:hypothetical protein